MRLINPSHAIRTIGIGLVLSASTLPAQSRVRDSVDGSVSSMGPGAFSRTIVWPATVIVGDTVHVRRTVINTGSAPMQLATNSCGLLLVPSPGVQPLGDPIGCVFVRKDLAPGDSLFDEQGAVLTATASAKRLLSYSFAGQAGSQEVNVVTPERLGNLRGAPAPAAKAIPFIAQADSFPGSALSTAHLTKFLRESTPAGIVAYPISAELPRRNPAMPYVELTIRPDSMGRRWISLEIARGTGATRTSLGCGGSFSTVPGADDIDTTFRITQQIVELFAKINGRQCWPY